METPRSVIVSATCLTGGWRGRKTAPRQQACNSPGAPFAAWFADPRRTCTFPAFLLSSPFCL
eukprot:4385171-Pyramimonas_sp.AAC.1